jgi:hypothetical protein
MKSTPKTAPKTANDNAARATPTLDALLPIVRALVPAELGWALAGWAARLRDTAHPLHAANSWAKHCNEFGRVEDLAAALTVARLVDFGDAADEAAALLRARVTARSRKAA